MDDGSIKSPEALADPLGPANTIEGDFLHLALLKGVVTDTHFKERDRLGRLFAFVAKAQVGRAADAPAMIGLGVDESAALAVEPDGSGRIYATAPDGYAWVVDGSGLRNVSDRRPLDAPRVKVTGVGPGSVVHLPSGRVDAPVFVRNYAARAGELVEAVSYTHLDVYKRQVLDRTIISPQRTLVEIFDPGRDAETVGRPAAGRGEAMLSLIHI